jgi:Asp-tRNA(Asn)/Glu-tRNA(Gln) amidotransferase A subunit family amidase
MDDAAFSNRRTTMKTEDLITLTATAAAAQIASRAITSEELTRACLSRIAVRDVEVQAFVHISPEYALKQARDRDREQQEGRPTGLLHGVPVAIKDIFDTQDFPTENGWPLHRGRRPAVDAAAVARLRRAGAVILGKTVTTECAYYFPGPTRNPHDITRTPGGSSSGSAAAVAANMVPIALGSQTNGSVIRPASFCGVFGGKPSHGLISRARVLSLSKTLDHVGVFARSIDDIVLAYDVLAGPDPDDIDTAKTPLPSFRAVMRKNGEAAPKFAFVRTPRWDDADLEMRAQFNRLVADLGSHAAPVDFPSKFADCWPTQRAIMAVEMNRSFGAEARKQPGKSSEMLMKLLDEGEGIPVEYYDKLIANVPLLRALFEDGIKGFDVAITPAAKGEAPAADSTGDPVFCTAWSLLGVPSITLPMLRGEHGLPIGVQIVGRKGDDTGVLRAARWLWRNSSFRTSV